MNDDLDNRLALALRILADAWEEQRNSAFTRVQVEGRLDALPDLSPEGAAASAASSRRLLERVDALRADGLPPFVSVALRQVRHSARLRSHAGDWYGLLIDPVGVGMYGMFLPTAYCGGVILNLAFQSLASAPFARPGDADRYLGLLADLAFMVDQMTARTLAQAERGMRMPRAQIPAARALVAAFEARSRAALGVADTRWSPTLAAGKAAFDVRVEQHIGERIGPAFDRLAALFDDAYVALAPETVGMSQYEGGAAIYRELVKLHTTLELTPAQVHVIGNERLVCIETQMRELRAAAGFADDAAGYLSSIRANPLFNANDTAGVAAVFERYIDRMHGVFDRAFHAAAKAPHGVAQIPEALQASMTFGYYDAPKPGQPRGTFLFNAAHLTRTSLFNVAALTYHELVPGHHLHLSTQQENELLHPVSRYAFCNAFNEGWAEYAATLAGELGCYEAPEEQYGRLIMDAFLTCRLVVDTGMNALGWSLERAREFLHRHSAMSEAEIASETLRYSCDIPAQALAYKLGDTEILRMRELWRTARGDGFDQRDFHAAVLENGAMPLPDLAAHVERRARSS